MPIDNEVTPITEEPAVDSFADNEAIQDSLRDSAASAQRIFELESEANPVADPSDIEPTQSRLRLTPRGKAVGGVVLASAVATTAALVAPAAVDAVQGIQEGQTKAHVETLSSYPTIDVTVQSGDGLQKIIQENVPQVASGQFDWRDVASDIGYLPQNSDISKPGYVLVPGDTVTIPIYGSTEEESKNGQ